MSTNKEALGIAEADVVTFRLGTEVLAVPAADLREVLEPVRITRVPGASRFVSGLLNVRGAVVPLADLRVPLNIPDPEDGASSRILVLDLPLGGRDNIVGIVADSVHEVTRIGQAALEDIPAVGTRWPPRYVAAIGRWEDEFVTIPDLATIFDDFLSDDSARTISTGTSGAGQLAESEAI